METNWQRKEETEFGKEKRKQIILEQWPHLYRTKWSDDIDCINV